MNNTLLTIRTDGLTLNVEKLLVPELLPSLKQKNQIKPNTYLFCIKFNISYTYQQQLEGLIFFYNPNLKKSRPIAIPTLNLFRWSNV